MKATQRDFAAVAPRAALHARIAFFCGPDEAGASAAASKLVSMLPNAGDRIELSGPASPILSAWRRSALHPCSPFAYVVERAETDARAVRSFSR